MKLLQESLDCNNKFPSSKLRMVGGIQEYAKLYEYNVEQMRLPNSKIGYKKI